jgi:predicted metal-binding protein
MIIRSRDMNEKDLKKYCDYALQSGASSVIQIHPSSVVTAPWVRLKCQFGCGGYNYGYCCPPHTPTAEETRRILDCYDRALLFHLETSWSKDRGKRYRNFLKILTDLEGDMFKDGYYKAFVFLAGPCNLCKECGKVTGTFCTHSDRARPSMESCGIDVFQTARNNGFHIETLREEREPRNNFCLMLVD